MKNYSFYVNGMHCVNCALRIQETLEKLPGVKNVSVSFAKGTANFKAEKFSIEKANKEIGKLDEKYKLSENPDYSRGHEHSHSPFEVYKPLIIVYSAIILFTLLRWSVLSYDWTAAMADFMGAFFIVFGGFKLANYKNFPASFKRYDLLAKWIPGYAQVYPFIELSLGVGFLLRFNMPILAVITLIVMGIGSLGIIKALQSKKIIECACLGGFFKLPMSQVTLFEDVSMVVMALVMLLL